MLTVVIQIDNSDDKLSQREWAQFCIKTNRLVRSHGTIHFTGFSIPAASYQNAGWVVEAHAADVASLVDGLRGLADEFRQDSIAITTGETEFVRP